MPEPTDFEAYLAPSRGPRAGRISSVDHALAAIPDQARLLIPALSGVPIGLLAALDEARGRWSALEIVAGALRDPLPPQAHVLAPFTFATWQFSRALGAAAEAGALRVIPARYSQTADLFQAQGPVPVDAVLVSCSPPGPDGRYSLGVSVGSVIDAVRSAPLVVGQVNTRMPYVFGAGELPAEAFDFLVKLESPLPELQRVPPGPVEEAVAENVVALVPDEATLQFGLGAVPEAVMARLGARRDLGVHSGMISDGLMDLAAGGALTNARKRYDRGVMIAAEAPGTRRFFDWLHRNPLVRLAPARYSHGSQVVASSHRLVTINSAVSVALDGSVNAETIKGRAISGPGGQPDYAEAAIAARDGIGIVALPATAAGGRVSRIVPRLAAEDGTTVPRVLADHIVTEYGVAALRGRSLEERAEALRTIAHPDFRASLHEGRLPPLVATPSMLPAARGAHPAAGSREDRTMPSFSFESMLAKTELFENLDEAELGPFAAKSQLHTYQDGQEITRGGELGTGLYVVTKGSVDIIANRGTPEEAHVATLHEGGFFGDMALLLEHPRSATIVAREFTECLVLTRWDFKDLALEHPGVLWNMLEVVAKRLAEADANLERHL